jgi:hypothetical protein
MTNPYNIKMPGPRVTKLLGSLLDQHGLIGAIEAVRDGQPFTRERRIALLAHFRDDHKKSRARAKAAQRREQSTHPRYDHRAENPSSTEKITSFDWEAYRAEARARERELSLEMELTREMINAGYRTLAKEHHPDRGRSKETMARLTRTRDQWRFSFVDGPAPPLPWPLVRPGGWPLFVPPGDGDAHQRAAQALPNQISG